VAGRAKDDLVARRGPAIGVGGRVGWIFVRAEVGFNLHNAAGEPAGAGAMRQYFAQEARGNLLWRGFKEGAL